MIIFVLLLSYLEYFSFHQKWRYCPLESYLWSASWSLLAISPLGVAGTYKWSSVYLFFLLRLFTTFVSPGEGGILDTIWLVSFISLLFRLGLFPGLVLLPSFGLAQIVSTLARTLHGLGKCTQCLDTWTSHRYVIKVFKISSGVNSIPSVL